MDTTLPHRKSIRLKDYDYTQNGYYFITICTHDHQCLFGQIVGATPRGRPNHPDKMIEKWLFKLEDKFSDVVIDDYIIMPNHVHFIIKKLNVHISDTGGQIQKTGDHIGSPLRDIVGWFKTMTTNEYINGVKNNKYPPFHKKLWQRNYYEHIIRGEQDYIQIAEYIQNNPLNWEKGDEYHI